MLSPHIEPTPNVCTFDGRQATVYGQASFKLFLGKYSTQVSGTVMDLYPGCDLLLGVPWLKPHGAALDHEYDHMVIRRNDRKYLLKHEV